MAEPEQESGFRPPENGTPDAVKAWLAEQNRTNELSALQKASDFIGAVHGIDSIEGGVIPDEVKKEALKRNLSPEALKEEMKTEYYENLRERYEDYVVAQLGPISDMEDAFDRLHNEVPWESRYGEQTYSTIVDLVDNALRKTRRVDKEEDKKIEVALLKEMKRTALWAQGNFFVLEGSATAIDTYFAGEDQMRQLFTNHVKITETAFEKAFSKDLPGLGLDDEQRARFREELAKDTELGSGVESVRELLTSFQDDRMRLAMMVAEVQQEDFDNPPSADPAKSPRERNAMYLDPRKRQFIYQVFGVEGTDVAWVDKNNQQHLVPGEILNYYCMEPTEDNKRTYKALMQAALSLNALRQLDENGDVSEIAANVKKRASEILDDLYGEEKYSLREKLAGIIVRAGIDIDSGLMACGELGWGWKYEKYRWSGLTPEEQKLYIGIKQDGEVGVKWSDLTKDEQVEYLKNHPGKIPEDFEKVKLDGFVVFRTSETGSIYSALDTWSPMYPDYHVWMYHGNAETTSQLLLATPHDFRMEAMTHKPDWRPPIENYLGYNAIDRKMIYKLFTGGFKNDEVWKGTTFGELDPRVVKYMKKNMKAWVSWPTFGKDKDGKEQRFAIPMFTPASWLSLNFWRALGEDGKDVKGAPSLWERFKEGAKLSEVPYTKYKDLSVDWTHVNAAQFARVLMMQFLPHKLSNDIKGEYDKFFPEGGPSAEAIKEIAKRIRLGTRGEPADMGVVEIAMIPVLLSLHLFRKHRLFDVVREGGGPLENAWREEISKWQVEAANLPPQKGLKRSAIKNYGKSIAMLLDFYTPILLEYAKLGGGMIRSGDSDSRERLENRTKNAYKLPDSNMDQIKELIG